jgi:hypothetical protein
MAEHSGPDLTRDRGEFATYAAELTSELARVARQHGLDALGYLLEMAHMEAQSTARSARAAGNKKPKAVQG